MNNNSTFHFPHSTFPIDLVYMWVDGSDPKFIAKKNSALAAIGREQIHKYATVGRFDDNDELKFSLRSAEKFMPWINHIYVVTDNQTPKWLDTKNPKITVIDLNTIVPKKYLPLFNSVAIEMFLSEIPELSEHFIYSNDDMMAGRPVSPDFFYDSDGNPILMLREKRRQKMRSMVGSQIGNARNLVFAATGKKYFMTLTHAMDPYIKKQLRDVRTKFLPEYEKSTFTTFRKQTNIQRIFVTFYNNVLGKNTIVLPERIGTQRIKIGANEPWVKTIIRGIVRFIVPVTYDFYDAKSIKKVKKIKPYIFCINNGKAFRDNLSDMKKLLPTKSWFEK